LTLDDLRVGRRFEDAVTFGTFNVDIHRLEPGGAESKSHCTPIKPYEIPYRCLLPADIQGLIVAGRCISGTHEAHASYRVTGTCCAMGQAAGLAASMAVLAGRLPSQVDGRDLRRAVVDRDAAMLPAV